MYSMKFPRVFGRVLAFVCAGVFLTGCHSADPSFTSDPLSPAGGGMAGPGVSSTSPGVTAGSSQPMVDPSGKPILHVRDGVVFTMQDVNPSVTPMETTVKEDGT